MLGQAKLHVRTLSPGRWRRKERVAARETTETQRLKPTDKYEGGLELSKYFLGI